MFTYFLLLRFSQNCLKVLHTNQNTVNRQDGCFFSRKALTAAVVC